MNTTLRILAPAVAAAFVLTGCSLAENAVEGAVEKGIEGATGTDIEAGDDGFSVKTEDGEYTVGGDGSLPEGFPEGEVPLVAGDIGTTAKVNDGGADAFAVTVNASGSVEEVSADAVSLLEGAGFTIGAEIDMGGAKSATLEGSGSVEAVTLAVMEGMEDGSSSVSYTVVMGGQ